jgi:hypothetical protein
MEPGKSQSAIEGGWLIETFETNIQESRRNDQE